MISTSYYSFCRAAITVLFIFIPVMGIAAIRPANNSILNFTQVLFEVEDQPEADTYRLFISNSVSPEKKFQITTTSLACMLRDSLQFGQRYQWYYEALKAGNPVFKSSLYSFSIANNFLIDKSNFRFQVINSTEGFIKTSLFLLDNTGIAINRKGEPVWYMPVDSPALDKMPQYRNLNITKTGSFTYLKEDKCFEKDISGNILWQAPNDGKVSGDKTEYYHHDFLKPTDSTYLTCSYRYDTSMALMQEDESSRVRYNTVILYHKSGKVLWSWNEKKHITDDEIAKASGKAKGILNGTHMNGFAFNEKQGLYVFSFRNSNTLLGVNNKTGAVNFKICGTEKQNLAKGIGFNGQHSPVFTRDGQLLLYNNNMEQQPGAQQPTYPSVLLLELPGKGKTGLKKIWEYVCKLKDYPDGLVGKEGYAEQLPDKNILISLGGSNKIIEVTPENKIVWELNCELYNSQEKKWTGFNNYRVHPISSLYPYYFTVQQPAPLNADKKITLKINNDGSEDDQYEVVINYKNGIKKLPAIPIKAYQSKTVSFDPSPYKNNNGYTITIKPVHVEGKSIVITKK